MRRARYRLRTLALWVVALGLLSLGICCLGAPGAMGGWIAACHSGESAGHCVPQSTTGCLMTHLAAPDQASDAEPKAERAPQLTVATAAAPARPGASPGHSVTGDPLRGPFRGGTTSVFLLHSSFLL